VCKIFTSGAIKKWDDRGIVATSPEAWRFVRNNIQRRSCGPTGGAGGESYLFSGFLPSRRGTQGVGPRPSRQQTHGPPLVPTGNRRSAPRFSNGLELASAAVGRRPGTTDVSTARRTAETSGGRGTRSGGPDRDTYVAAWATAKGQQLPERRRGERGRPSSPGQTRQHVHPRRLAVRDGPPETGQRPLASTDPTGAAYFPVRRTPTFPKWQHKPPTVSTSTRGAGRPRGQVPMLRRFRGGGDRHRSSVRGGFERGS